MIMWSPSIVDLGALVLGSIVTRGSLFQPMLPSWFCAVEKANSSWSLMPMMVEGMLMVAILLFPWMIVAMTIGMSLI